MKTRPEIEALLTAITPMGWLVSDNLRWGKVIECDFQQIFGSIIQQIGIDFS